MDTRFFEQPILNSPYEYPSRHWELDAAGQPTNEILSRRRKVAFISAIPNVKKSSGGQREMVFDKAAQALGSDAQQHDLTAFIGGVRQRLDRWRELPDPGSWQVTPETARLLQHWRSHRFGDIRPFFCQVEAVETAIWLTEVAPHLGREGSGSGTAGAEARHRGREDHGHGRDHRLTDRQRGAPAGQQAVHARFPGGDPRRDDPGPAAGAPAERSRQLLRQPRAGAERHAPRPGAGEDRHHQLPRVPAARNARSVEGRSRPAPRPRIREGGAVGAAPARIWSDIAVVAEGDAYPDGIAWDEREQARPAVLEWWSRSGDLVDPNAYGIRIRGDSMLPAFSTEQ